MAKIDFDAETSRLKELLEAAKGGHKASARELALSASRYIPELSGLHELLRDYLLNGLQEIADGGDANHGFFLVRKKSDGGTGNGVDPRTKEREFEIACLVYMNLPRQTKRITGKIIEKAAEQAVLDCEKNQPWLLTELGVGSNGVAGAGPTIHTSTFKQYYSRHAQSAREYVEGQRKGEIA